MFCFHSIVDASLCPDCISGQRDCSSEEPICWIKGECLGTEVQFLSTQTKEECLEACKNTLACAWFTFRSFKSQEPICQLFSDCSSLDETCETCISGERRCEVEDQTTTTASSTTTTTTTTVALGIHFLCWVDMQSSKLNIKVQSWGCSVKIQVRS